MIKGKIYTPQTKLELLKVHRISKSQAWQRTGRAGRESAGTCYRLYTETEYESMQLNTVPEILRSNLLSVVLNLLALGVSDLLGFDFMSKPSVDSLGAALDELELLGAVKKGGDLQNGHHNGHGLMNGDSDESVSLPASKRPKLDASDHYELTDLGAKMAQFPLDPKLSRCILAAEKLNCVEEVLRIVSMLSVDNVFINEAAKREHVHAIRQKFESADGDHITLLNAYKAYVANKTIKV
jgi:ATP-dependent RNA helicase DHX33